MKIAYLLGSLNRGGTETLLLDVFRNAKKNNLDAIGLFRKTGVLEAEFLNSGVPINKLSVGNNLMGYLFRLRKFLIENNINIAHAQQPIDALYARIAGIGTGLKVILTLHGYDFNEANLGQKILKYIITHTEANIFVSDTQRQHYQEKYGLTYEKQHVVYNGVSFDKLNTTQQMTPSNQMVPSPIRSATSSRELNDNLRDELQLSTDTLLLGSVGNFVPCRDQLTLCRFLRLIHQQKVDFHFVFVGKRADNVPQLYEDCYNYCNQNKLLDKVSFLGSRNDVPQILSQLDAFVYASDHDTFGIAVVEAMAVGIPVFVNDWGVMKEITEDGKYATLYKTKDEGDLVQQFMLFLHDKSAYQAKAKEAARFVREKYSIEKHIEELMEVYSG
ncbi:MAG: glycosyltransferase family 4 protein [Paludibacter sp.]|nr:glycosyltransferase family 4 protein [Paludibacter sp.]